MLERLRERTAELQREWTRARQEHPAIAYGVVGAFTLVALLTLISGVAFLVSLPSGLPDDAALSRIGEMDQATAVFDQSDQLAFTIYKEQRIEVPLSGIAPRLVQAVIAIE